jgi:hypothetical protein
VEPSYNHVEWQEDAKRADVIKRTMCLYPEFYEQKDQKELAEKTKQVRRGDGGLRLC